MNKLVQLNYDTVASIEYWYEKVSDGKKAGTVNVKNDLRVVTFMKNGYEHRAYSIDYKSLSVLNLAMVEMINERKTITNSEFNDSNALPF